MSLSWGPGVGTEQVELGPRGEFDGQVGDPFLLSCLESSELGLDASHVQRVFDPFVVRRCEGRDTAWGNEIRRRQRKLVKQGLRRIIPGWKDHRNRGVRTVLEEYQSAWDKIDYRIYDTANVQSKATPWLWRGKRMLASGIGGTRFRQLLLCRAIERLQPRHVLEVGCGNGINLMLLSCRFPDIVFTGLELTEAGHKAARTLQGEPELPAAMQEFAPFPLADATAFRRIDFVRGNAAALPFANGSFDLVYSVLALEQMESIRTRALEEVARAARRNVLMIEPFRDVNRGFWTRLNIYRRNYFRGSIDELRRFGLRPRFATGDFPQEVVLRLCMVIAEKVD